MKKVLLANLMASCLLDPFETNTIVNHGRFFDRSNEKENRKKRKAIKKARARNKK